MAKVDITRRYIAETFLDLVERMPYSDVTVQLVVRTCGVSRKTFYYHFDNRADLVHYTFRMLLARRLERCMAPEDLAFDSMVPDDKYRTMALYYQGSPEQEGEEFFRAFSLCIRDNVTFFRKVFASPDWESLNRYVFAIYRPLLRRDLESLFAGSPAMPNEEVMDYLSLYFTNLSVIWIIHRRIMRDFDPSAKVTDILGCSIYDAMRGIVQAYPERLAKTEARYGGSRVAGRALP